MNTPRITKIWICDFSDRSEIRVDFDNDRHFAALIEQPESQRNIADAFIRIAHMIARDPHLKAIPAEKGGE
jgi:hypothetical protein